LAIGRRRGGMWRSPLLLGNTSETTNGDAQGYVVAITGSEAVLPFVELKEGVVALVALLMRVLADRCMDI
jgi:hypothetical protein